MSVKYEFTNSPNPLPSATFEPAAGENLDKARELFRVIAQEVVQWPEAEDAGFRASDLATDSKKPGTYTLLAMARTMSRHFRAERERIP